MHVAADAVTARRLEKGLSVRELSTRSGVSEATIRRISRGEAVSPLSIGRLARALDVDYSTFGAEVTGPPAAA
jgi:transcriptional regulator with XRE-family HTH domain